MSIEITHVRYGGEHRMEGEIIGYRWRGIATGTRGENDTPTLVDWVDNGGNAFVAAGTQQVRLKVIRPHTGSAYLHAHGDEGWTNDLLKLPFY